MKDSDDTQPGDMDGILAGIDGRILQEAATLHAWLRHHGRDMDDLAAWLAVTDLQAREARRAGPLRVLTDAPCPECGSRLVRRRIRLPKGPANRYGYTRHEYCPNPACRFERYGHD